MVKPVEMPRLSVRRLPENARAILANIESRWARRQHAAKLPLPIIFLVLLLLLLAAIAFPFDESISRWARSWPDWLKHLAGRLTHAAKAKVYIFPAVLALIVLGTLSLDASARGRFNRIVSWIGLLYLVVLTLLLSEAASSILKFAIGRVRPSHIDVSGMNVFHPFTSQNAFLSFPSGHATDIAALATILAFVFWRWRFAFAGFALVIASTRVALQEHFPSDVLAGLALGTLCGALVVIAFAELGYVFRRDNHGWPVVKPSFRLTR